MPNSGANAMRRIAVDGCREDELVTLPAIRAFSVPPFWAIGSRLLVSGLSWGWRPSAAGRRRRRRGRSSRRSSPGYLANVKRLWHLAHVDVGVLDVAADQQVADRAADRDVGIDRVAVGRKRRDDVRLLIVTLSMPRPNEMLREPDGASRSTLSVWPPM